jgi:hypothetical protein
MWQREAWTVGVLGTLLAGSVTYGAAAPHGEPKMKMIVDSVVDEAALNFVDGPFGTCINGQTFQQDGITSMNGFQYAVYFAQGGVVSLGRRQLPQGDWQSLRLEDYRLGDHRDVHNVAVVGLCPGDGSIHLAFDHHTHPLNYRRSIPGPALAPTEQAWRSSLFGKTTSALEPGKPLAAVTYPQFVRTPQGALQLLYRLGGSGDGDWHLAEYGPTNGAWRSLGMLFSRKGSYETSASRCAYPNPPRYDHAGRLHVTWCWRERPSNKVRGLTTNHDVHYAYSDDYGRTWQNNAGAVVARLGMADPRQDRAIGIDTPGVVVWKTPYQWGQMNTTTQCHDTRGRVHVINWQNPPNSPEPTLDMNRWRYFHYWRDTEGTWHENRLPFHGRKPQIVVDATGNAYVVYCQTENSNYHQTDAGGFLTIAVAGERSAWTDWRVVHREERRSVGEPLVDLPRWEQAGILSVTSFTTGARPVGSIG